MEKINTAFMETTESKVWIKSISDKILKLCKTEEDILLLDDIIRGFLGSEIDLISLDYIKKQALSDFKQNQSKSKYNFFGFWRTPDLKQK
jgi:hypothetical protein